MRSQLIKALVLILGCATANGATKLYLSTNRSAMGTIAKSSAGTGCNINTSNWTYRRLVSTAPGTGSSVVYPFTPSAAGLSCWWQSANSGGDFLTYISAPLTATATISGTVTGGVAECNSSDGSNGATAYYSVYRWSAANGGIVGNYIARFKAMNSSSKQCDGAGPYTGTATPTSTNFSVGDRIVVRIEVVLTSANSGITENLTANHNSSFIQFNENLSITTDAADVNTARKQIHTTP
jgi:hypothetical protein